MADAGVGKESSNTLLEIVECGICNEVMAHPMALTCLHHFCKSCTDKFDRSRGEDGNCGVSCPNCRRFTYVNDIQQSFIMRNILDKYNISKEQSNLKHADVTNNHSVANYCSEHSNCVIKYRCIPCNLLLCPENLIESHREHKTESIDDAFQTIQKQAHFQMSETKQNKDTTKAILDKLKYIKHTKEIALGETKKKLHDHKLAMVAKLESDYVKICERLDIEYVSRTACVTAQIQDVENRLANFEDLLASIDTITNMGCASDYLREARTGLLKKMEEATKHISERSNFVFEEDMKSVYFEPEEVVEEQNYLGKLVCDDGYESQARNNHVNGNHPNRSGLRSYRHTGFKLTALLNSTLTPQKMFTLKHPCFRICYNTYNNTFLCPSAEANCIDVYSKDGTHTQTFQNKGITNPRTVHPLRDGTTLLVAAENGLFHINMNGEIITTIIHDKFIKDVHVDNNITVALELIEKGCGEVHVFNMFKGDKNPNRCQSFKLGNNGCNRILLVNNTIYVSFDQTGTLSVSHTYIKKYHLNGNKLGKYGKFGSGAGYGVMKRIDGSFGSEELHLPFLCGSDDHGNVIFADCMNMRFKLLQSQGKFSVLFNRYRSGQLVYDVIFSTDKVMYGLFRSVQENKFQIDRFYFD